MIHLDFAAQWTRMYLKSCMCHIDFTGQVLYRAPYV